MSSRFSIVFPQQAVPPPRVAQAERHARNRSKNMGATKRAEVNLVCFACLFIGEFVEVMSGKVDLIGREARLQGHPPHDKATELLGTRADETIGFAYIGGAFGSRNTTGIYANVVLVRRSFSQGIVLACFGEGLWRDAVFLASQDC